MKILLRIPNKSLDLTILFIYAHLDLACTKLSHSLKWRVQNLFSKNETKVTRQFGDYGFFLRANTAYLKSSFRFIFYFSMTAENVTGVVCADNRGLCLGGKLPNMTTY